MKKKILLFTTLTFLGYILLTSESNGPAQVGYNRTGSKGNPNTCGALGCHGTGTGPTVTITLDSNGTAVTHYKDGLTYKVKIHGSGTTNPKYGFQFCAVTGAGTSQVSAGTLNSTGTMNVIPVSGISIIEHSLPFTAVTAGTYDTSFTWKAPTTAGGGTITMYCTINAVNGNGTNDNGDVSGNTSITLAEISNVGVNTVLNNIAITTYPNPVNNILNVEMSGAEAGAYNIHVYDLRGKNMFTQSATVNTTAYQTTINSSNWAAGMYLLQIEKDGVQRTVQIVKQ